MYGIQNTPKDKWFYSESQKFSLSLQNFEQIKHSHQIALLFKGPLF